MKRAVQLGIVLVLIVSSTGCMDWIGGNSINSTDGNGATLQETPEPETPEPFEGMEVSLKIDNSERGRIIVRVSVLNKNNYSMGAVRGNVSLLRGESVEGRKDIEFARVPRMGSRSTSAFYSVKPGASYELVLRLDTELGPITKSVPIEAVKR